MRKSHIAVAAVAIVATGWALFRPERLFIDRSVNETFPFEAAIAAASSTAPAGAMATSGSVDVAAMSPDSLPVALATGEFHSNAHETTGRASIFRLGDGRRVLRLTKFATSNGPDVRVYLVAAPDVQDPEVVKRAGFIDLGGMKGNVGDQNYEVPADVNLDQYRSVSIWCRRFSVNFGAAPLTAAP